jgi:hypothetical protein
LKTLISHYVETMGSTSFETLEPLYRDVHSLDRSHRQAFVRSFPVEGSPEGKGERKVSSLKKKFHYPKEIRVKKIPSIRDMFSILFYSI